MGIHATILPATGGAISFNDGLCHGGRTPRLWIVDRTGTIHRFDGKNGQCWAVLTETREQNGKWSNSTFRIALAEGAQAVQLLAPLHGKVWENVSHSAEALAEFQSLIGRGCDAATFTSAIAADFPGVAKRWEETEAALTALDAASSVETEIVSTTVPARNPAPLLVVAPSGEDYSLPLGEVKPGDEWATDTGTVKVLSVSHTPGFRGGSNTLRLAVPHGHTVR